MIFLRHSSFWERQNHRDSKNISGRQDYSGKGDNRWSTDFGAMYILYNGRYRSLHICPNPQNI